MGKLKAPRKDTAPRKLEIIDNPTEPWSVKLLGLATAVAGMEYALPAMQAVMPPHWYAVVFPAILVARLVKQAHDNMKSGG